MMRASGLSGYAAEEKKYSIWAKICVVFYTWMASLRCNVGNVWKTSVLFVICSQ